MLLRNAYPRRPGTFVPGFAALLRDSQYYRASNAGDKHINRFIWVKTGLESEVNAHRRKRLKVATGKRSRTKSTCPSAHSWNLPTVEGQTHKADCIPARACRRRFAGRLLLVDFSALPYLLLKEVGHRAIDLSRCRRIGHIRVVEEPMNQPSHREALHRLRR